MDFVIRGMRIAVGFDDKPDDASPLKARFIRFRCGQVFYCQDSTMIRLALSP